MAGTSRLVSVMVGLELPCDEVLTELAEPKEFLPLRGLFGLEFLTHDAFLGLGSL